MLKVKALRPYPVHVSFHPVPAAANDDSSQVAKFPRNSVAR